MSTSPDVPAMVDTDQPCIRCGYSLRGLPHMGVCPECGTPVERSFKGDLLIYSDERYLRSLKRGAELVMASLLSMVVLAVLPVSLSLAGMRSAAHYTEYLSLATAGLFLYGWWLLTTADPGQLGTNKGERPRQLTRIAFAIALTIKVFYTALELFKLTDEAGGLVAAMVSSIATAVGLFAGLRFVRWLTPRIPNPRAFKRARSMTTFFTILIILSMVSALPKLGMTMAGVGRGASGMSLGATRANAGVLFMGCGGGIPALVALIMYFNLFWWVHADFRNILRLQAQESALKKAMAIAAGRVQDEPVPPEPSPPGR